MEEDQEKMERERGELLYRLRSVLNPSNDGKCYPISKIIKGIDIQRLTKDVRKYLKNKIWEMITTEGMRVYVTYHNDEVCVHRLIPIPPQPIPETKFNVIELEVVPVFLDYDMLGVFANTEKYGWVFIWFSGEKIRAYKADAKRWKETIMGIIPPVIYNLNRLWAIGWVWLGFYFKNITNPVDFTKDIWKGKIIYFDFPPWFHFEGFPSLYYDGLKALYYHYKGDRKRETWDFIKRVIYRPDFYPDFLKHRYPQLKLEVEIVK